MLAAHAPTPGPSNSTIERRDLCSLAVSPASFDSSRLIRLQLYTMCKRGGQRGLPRRVPNKGPRDRWSPSRGSLAGPPVTRLSLVRTDFSRLPEAPTFDEERVPGKIRRSSCASFATDRRHELGRNLKRRGERIPRCCRQGSNFDSSNAPFPRRLVRRRGKRRDSGRVAGIRLAANALVVFVVG